MTLFFSAFGSQKTAVTPIEELGRCHSACRGFRFCKGFPGIAKELPAARRAKESPAAGAPLGVEDKKREPFPTAGDGSLFILMRRGHGSETVTSAFRAFSEEKVPVKLFSAVMTQSHRGFFSRASS